MRGLPIFQTPSGVGTAAGTVIGAMDVGITPEEGCPTRCGNVVFMVGEGVGGSIGNIEKVAIIAIGFGGVRHAWFEAHPIGPEADATGGGA